MSLEAALAANTAALERNSNILESGLKKVAGAAGAAAGGKAAGAAGGKPAGTKATGPKKPSEDDIRNSFGPYLAVKDKTEKEARKVNVRAILDHFGVNLASEIPEENRAEAISYVTMLTNGETPDFMNEAGTDEDEGGGLL